jgi:hypothetical protein
MAGEKGRLNLFAPPRPGILVETFFEIKETLYETNHTCHCFPVHDPRLGGLPGWRLQFHRRG